MITRIQATAKITRVITTTPTCNGSKSRAMQQHTKTANLTTTTTTAAGLKQKHTTSHTMTTTTTRARRAATTLRRCSLAALQVLVLVCALPPPLQPLRLSPQHWSGAVEALPITSKPIEGTAENLAWQAWLMLPPEQKQLEKSRKVTPKSIFSLPFRDCPPGHQLFQSRCIPTVNINQSDLLTQQVLGLFGGSDAGGTGATGNDNAYEIDYGDEEYDLGLGEGEPVMMYEAPQPYNGGFVVGASNTQQPPARDEPLKFNLFEQKFPTNDYEADISSGAMEGSGGARPLTELLASNGSEGERVGVVGNDNDAGAAFFNSTQFLDAVQGFFQRHESESNATVATAAGSNANTTDHNIRAVNGTQVLADLSVAGSNVSTFEVGDIDAIILPAVGAGTTAKTAVSGHAGDLEPQRISLFKDDSSVHLVTTVIAQPASDRRSDGEGVDAGDLVAAAQQQEESVTQFLRADALLPLSSAAPYITTTATAATTTTATTLNTHAAGHAPETLPMEAKDEHPRSVTTQNATTAVNNTDAQETSFITTTEPEGTTNFQIDETTVIEAQDVGDTVAAESNLSLLEAISQQQQLELEKSKATDVEDVPPSTTTLLLDANNEETTVAGDNQTTESKTIVYETSETSETTTQQHAAEERADTAETTTVQPLPSAGAAPARLHASITPQGMAASTPSTYRFRNTPTVAAAAITPIQLPSTTSAAHKQVSSVVTTVVPQTAELLAVGEEATTRVSVDSAIVSDVPRSANTNNNDDDLVNVVAASINSDIDNDSNKYKNAELAEAGVNIAQELQMINELVKGNRQATATKMAATQTTETAAVTTATAETTVQSTTTLSAASVPSLEVQKSANAAEQEQDKSVSGAAAFEVRQDVDGATTTAAATTTTQQVTDASTMNESSSPAASSSEIVTPTTATTTTAQSLSLTKMESANQRAESTTVENAQIIETSSKQPRDELKTPKSSAEPDFETEATATDTEVFAATTLWSRIMPIFGFGGSASVADVAESTTTTTAVAESTSIGSISSNNSSISRSSSSSSSSSSSKSSLSEKSSSMDNSNNNNNNIIINNKSDFDTPTRRNSKIIRIDHFSDNTVATAATTTNTLEDTAAAIAKTTDDFAIAPDEHEPMSQSAYWWLPANWRLNRGTTEEQPLLFRLWSAFPESQMKTKVRT
ncbi:serine-rich adhesin for platelets [Zeugodacus cucurbitae]|nr:serine-rich adhesin for platelets [Zeugodacus cucurbitae]XP_054086720.1 serine-rich adhesin for platelets [Zeugodacus cucurbitae]